MKKAVLLIFSVLLLAAPALAQYNIHLKNGSVIKGVGSYEEIDGQIIFHYAGGMVTIPADEVEKIEEVGREGRVFAPEEAGPPPPREAPKPPEMPPFGESAEAKSIKARIVEIDRRLEEIARKEAEYEDMKEEYNRVRLVIEVRFQQGLAEARKQGGDPDKWFEFLPPLERKWVQLNTLRKNKLKKELAEKEEELAQLSKEKRELEEEKQDLQERLSRIQSIL